MTSEAELRQKIVKYKATAAQLDPLTGQRIRDLIVELEDQLRGLEALPDHHKR